MTSPLLEPLLKTLREIPDIEAVTLFGSCAQGINDPESDIDLQIITRRPERFRSGDWLNSFGRSVSVYAWRPAFGGVVKATAIFQPRGEADLVVIPRWRMRMAALLVSFGVHRRSPKISMMLGHLTIVLRPGFQVVHGSEKWAKFFSRVLGEVPDPRLDNAEVERLAACAFADFLSIEHKLSRGEFLAAQRWLHLHLVEVALKLNHEYRVRRNLPAFHDARRAELILSRAELESLSVNAQLERTDLARYAAKMLETIYQTTSDVLGRPPMWALPQSADRRA